MKSYMYEIPAHLFEGTDESKWVDSKYNMQYDSPLGNRYTVGKIDGKYIIVRFSLWAKDWEDNQPIEIHVLSKYAARRFLGRDMIGSILLKEAQKRALWH